MGHVSSVDIVEDELKTRSVSWPGRPESERQPSHVRRLPICQRCRAGPVDDWLARSCAHQLLLDRRAHELSSAICGRAEGLGQQRRVLPGIVTESELVAMVQVAPGEAEHGQASRQPVAFSEDSCQDLLVDRRVDRRRRRGKVGDCVSAASVGPARRSGERRSRSRSQPRARRAGNCPAHELALEQTLHAAWRMA